MRARDVGAILQCGLKEAQTAELSGLSNLKSRASYWLRELPGWSRVARRPSADAGGGVTACERQPNSSRISLRPRSPRRFDPRSPSGGSERPGPGLRAAAASAARVRGASRATPRSCARLRGRAPHPTHDPWRQGRFQWAMPRDPRESSANRPSRSVPGGSPSTARFRSRSARAPRRTPYLQSGIRAADRSIRWPCLQDRHYGDRTVQHEGHQKRRPSSIISRTDSPPRLWAF